MQTGVSSVLPTTKMRDFISVYLTFINILFIKFVENLETINGKFVERKLQCCSVWKMFAKFEKFDSKLFARRRASLFKRILKSIASAL